MAEKLADFKAAKKYGFGDEGLLGEGSVRDGVGHYNLVKLISPLDYPKGLFGTRDLEGRGGEENFCKMNF